jgi:uroporphyrinogen decarboxylase
MTAIPFSKQVVPDWQGLLRCLRREATPERVHCIELFLDDEVQEEICQRYDLLDRLDLGDPYFLHRRQIRLQSFLGYDYVMYPKHVGESIGTRLALPELIAKDTAGLARRGGRAYVEEHKGPITTWEEFERYPWPRPQTKTARSLEWFEKHLPENMCLIGGLVGSIYENLSFLMGYETLCHALKYERDLVAAISERLIQIYSQAVEQLLQSERVKMIWASDDLGYRSGLLISPKDLREFILPGHKRLAQMTHAAGRLYLLHSCGELSKIMEELIEEVKIDAKHSFEDTILDVREAKRLWGSRLSLLGGLDINFLCLATAEDVRRRVNDTLEHCLPGGGYCLGTGNSVANYLPLDNYLAMLQAGREYL